MNRGDAEDAEILGQEWNFHGAIPDCTSSHGDLWAT